jgi:hypothetical protein
MTRPPDPGQPPRSGGPYRTPPQQWGPAGPPGGPPLGPPPQPDLAPRDAAPPPAKGFFGSLFDWNFNYLVTPKLIKIYFILSVVLITLQCVLILAFGLWVLSWDDWTVVGLFLVLATPFVWVLEIMLVRMILEWFIFGFKGTEYLRILKDRDGIR